MINKRSQDIVNKTDMLYKKDNYRSVKMKSMLKNQSHLVKCLKQLQDKVKEKIQMKDVEDDDIDESNHSEASNEYVDL
eukprot:CAMPEP_0170561166 /NCGR_PEP_ID=MMETSP0211-20121228/53137_1 /TAXON_ID=311385 /ORGANISM="Pseudokeronopsis sp., Strain OXSARD2" /LENGTH=77 /DNA_ID=CAMNT_0010876331 /DNA_START=136 /DNA_END=369 /DNA_ORIENTATION=+